ncbi:uncharacterized protein TRIADDRAFT_31319 [Trichoplax adhaerens]|uniref:Mini-chromosome maintenance complex-binding protein n=1 Tax=Trichoplax adhaerens TaxID=10228 RepID=B3S953_TRIAD|nr:hypothetical protein TRIADDRAFT_31319 [Trichoplax adhaerens]EDV20813.1 hypothetical protein TRIADDRAFT_31319 [Trichoplax adhaerens]|eukprot:XP_002116754.1 hypothetical protein TRIADDRAFT_31319 [Trichoplax adhaerens]
MNVQLKIHVLHCVVYGLDTVLAYLSLFLCRLANGTFVYFFFQVPSLNDTPIHRLPSNSLVKYRCMVQDMFDREFYLGVYEVHNEEVNTKVLKCGKYYDVARCPKNSSINLQSDRSVTLDRQVLYCVPIPGENQWAKDISYFFTSITMKLSNLCKFLNQDQIFAGMTTSVPSPNARYVPEPSFTSNKRRFDENNSSNNILPNLNFPLPNENGPACIVKIYEDTDNIKVNDMIEFFGILSVDPALKAPSNTRLTRDSGIYDPEIDMDCAEETAAHCPAPSLVPRLHCIIARHLPHSNPILPFDSPSEISINNTLEKPELIRSQLISTLTDCIGGDALAAEYTLLNLLSKVNYRHDVVPVGKFSVNLAGCPVGGTITHQLYESIEALVPKSYFLSMTLSGMNSLLLSPKKDYNANRLQSGILQLTAGTHLILDETVLEPGQLDPNGVKNLTALSNVVRWQKVDYDFSYHQTEFLCDLTVLVLSEGKSILPCDIVIPIRQRNSVTKAESNPIREIPFSFLQDFRTYLAVTRSLNYTVTNEMQQALQEDFVNSRKLDDKAMTADDFHLMLTMARLLTLSFGQTLLTPELWNRVKSLERHRKARSPSQ